MPTCSSGNTSFFLKLCIFLPGYKTERAQTADSPVREERLMGADTSACQLTQFHVESGVLVLLILKPSSFLTENHHLTTKWIFLLIKIFNFIFLIPHSSTSCFFSFCSFLYLQSFSFLSFFSLNANLQWINTITASLGQLYWSHFSNSYLKLSEVYFLHL